MSLENYGRKGHSERRKYPRSKQSRQRHFQMVNPFEITWEFNTFAKSNQDIDTLELIAIHKSGFENFLWILNNPQFYKGNEITLQNAFKIWELIGWFTNHNQRKCPLYFLVRILKRLIKKKIDKNCSGLDLNPWPFNYQTNAVPLGYQIWSYFDSTFGTFLLLM